MQTEATQLPLIYQAANGAIELRPDVDRETIWASQADISQLFDIDQSVVSRHINRVFIDGEVDRESNMQKMHITNSDKPVALYSLDVVLSVGYKTNSKIAIQFRKRASQIIKEYTLSGYAINKSVIQQNYDSFLIAVEQVKALAYHKDISSDDILELIKAFGQTRFSNKLHAGSG